MQNKQLVVAWDVDDTLIIPSVVTGARDVPNYDTIAIFRWYEAQGCRMVIWSGSGVDWAKTWAEKLGLKAEIWPKQAGTSICSVHKYPDRNCGICSSRHIVDIAFDDCDVDLGKVNVKVKRVDNFISRKEWNKDKHI